ncbi:hypothetical protein [Peribacillus asahii]|nr:hypothetical protein [Peribacillus asahii]
MGRKCYEYKDSESEGGLLPLSASKSFCSSGTRAGLSLNGFNLESLIGSEAKDEALLDAICNVWTVHVDPRIINLTKEPSKLL